METCPETTGDAGKNVCGQPVTDEISWKDPNTSYHTTVVKRVCAACADAYMGWRANWLNPARKPVS